MGKGREKRKRAKAKRGIETPSKAVDIEAYQPKDGPRPERLTYTAKARKGDALTIHFDFSNGITIPFDGVNVPENLIEKVKMQQFIEEQMKDYPVN